MLLDVYGCFIVHNFYYFILFVFLLEKASSRYSNKVLCRFDNGDDETHINFTQEEPQFEANLRPSLRHEDEIRTFTHLRNLLKSFL